MPRGKRTPDAIRNLAFSYYKQGLKNPEIAEKITKDTGFYVPVGLINKISSTEKWKDRAVDEHFLALDTKKVDLVKQEMEAKSLFDQQADAFHALWYKGYEALQDESFQLNRASDVMSAIEIGIKGERLVLSGILSAKLITEIITILTDEIQDQEMLRRIATKLKKAIVDYHLNATTTATTPAATNNQPITTN